MIHDAQATEKFSGIDVKEHQLLRVCGRQEAAVGVDAKRLVAQGIEARQIEVDVVLLDAVLVAHTDEPSGVNVGRTLEQAEVIVL